MILYRGIVKNGVVVLENGVTLPEGAPVRIEFQPATPPASPPTTSGEGQPLSEEVLKFAGTFEGLPADFARNHDHYIHGAPKK